MENIDGDADRRLKYVDAIQIKGRKRQLNRAREKLRTPRRTRAERVNLHQTKHDNNRAKQQVNDLQRHIHKASTSSGRWAIGLPV